MFQKLLPLLFLVGCLDAPNTPVATLKSTVNQPVEKEKTLSILYRSTDNGATWLPNGAGLPDDLIVESMATLGDQFLLSSENYGLYLSDPTKQRWQPLDTEQLPSKKITSLHVAKGVIYVGVLRKGIYNSPDLGQTWTSLNHNLEGELVKSILRCDDQLWIGVDDGIYALRDGAKAWQRIQKGPQVTSLLRAGDNFLAGTQAGILLSKDNGNTWSDVRSGLTTNNLALDGNVITAAFMGGEVETSADGGATWQPSQSGQPILGNTVQTVETSGCLKRYYESGNTALSDDFEVRRLFYTTPTESIIIMAKERGLLYGGRFVGC